MDSTLASLLSFYVFSTGRRLFAMAEVKIAALAFDLDEVAAQCEKTIAYDQVTRDLEAQWSSRDDAAAHAPEAKQADILVDVALGALRAAIDAGAHDAAPGDPLGEAAVALEKAAFPKGVAHITTLPFVEELSELRRVIALLEAPEQSDVVQGLGLGRRLARLVHLEKVYSAAVALPVRAVSFAQVNDARAKGQSMMLQAVATILGEYPSDSTKDLAARYALLAPILRQNDLIGGYLKARVAIEDVDPETGEVERAPAGETSGG